MKVKCLTCMDKGSYTDEDTGIDIRCNCTLVDKYKDKEVQIKDDGVKKGDNISAELIGLVPKERMEDNFSVEILKDRIIEQYGVRGYSIKGYNPYEELMATILYKIENKERIMSSYLIGSPNGMGKTTLANTSIKIMHKQGKKAVAYISLLELYDVYIEHLNRISEISDGIGVRFKDSNGDYGEKYSEVDEKAVKWKDVIDAEVLFTSLTSPEFSRLEISMLKIILNGRGKKMKPTIVFTDFALGAYTSKGKDGYYFWDEYIDYSTGKYLCYDKLRYLSCFRITSKNS